MTLAVGIDLGTTNSALAIKKIMTTIVRNAEGDELTPSCVTALNSTGKNEKNLVVGKHARDLMKQYPDQTIVSVKRILGREMEEPEVKKLLKDKRYGYQFGASDKESGSIEISLGGQKYSPESISAMILKKIVTDGAIELHETISEVVVTVPAYFSDRQKFATRLACEQAGLKVLRLLPEPTAAAVAFGMSEMSADDIKTVMVFDLGGGTFDVSVLNIASGQFMEISKGGDMWLGGDDIDLMIRNLVFEKVQTNLKISPITTLLERLDPGLRAKFIVTMKESCELAKIQLSTESEAHIESYGILRDENNKLLDIEVTITREDFDTLIKPLTTKLVQITENILSDIRYEPELIDMVLMVGGSSQIPAIQNALRQKFGAEKVKIHERPMFAIAEGAAIIAHKLSGSTHQDASSPINLMHSVAHDYYLQLANGAKHRLVSRNSPLPLSVEERLTFAQEGQSLARLRVLNEVDGILESVGELWFHGHLTDPLSEIETENNHSNEFVLKFALDEDNIIHMTTHAVDNPEHSAGAVIARDGVTLHLFSDLERTLSEISPLSAKTQFKNYQKLSKIITDTILSVSNPLTGIVQPSMKIKALEQIETLRELANAGVDPLYCYHYMQSFLKQPKGSLDDVSHAIVEKVAGDLRHGIQTLTDFDSIENAIETFDDHLEAHSFIADLGHALKIAREGTKLWPNISKKILSHISLIAEARNQGNQAGVKNHLDEINKITSEFSSEPIGFTNHFDRDVRLS